MKIRLTKEAKIGLVSILSLALLYIGINYLKGINLFQPANHYYVACTNVKEVTISSPVFVEGFKVGLVRAIAYDYETTDKIMIEISLEDKMRINKGSYISIEKSLLSGGELHIHLNKHVDDYLKPGSVIEGRNAEDMMQSMQTKILPGVEQLLPKLDSILYGLQTIVNHPALVNSLNQIEQTTRNLNQSTQYLNSILRNDIPVIVGNLKTISDDFTAVSKELKEIDFASTMNLVNATIRNLQMTSEKLNSTENSLGLLLNDKNLYLNLNETSMNASKLLLDLRENPKRYVRFSIF
ncbi:MAG: MlaD family protein [Massilibacteroides sp.]|nr:MlaD family protein [Massilibacteroides sp.]MDD3064004.1 MlaD family protein [Massilibacteroides sp.]MDD4116111.1 MlaD family protein [Massilibacteroides sp.]MDD4659589.1 MlaD family protein [Massilibacteroides sp.]